MKLKPLFWILIAGALLGMAILWHGQPSQKGSTSDLSKSDPEPTATPRPGVVSQRTAPAGNSSADSASAAAAASAVGQIVNAREDYRHRIRAVHMLSANLPASDQEILRGFLLDRSPADSEPGGQAFKNELMDQLCDLTPPPSWLGDTLVEIFRNRSQHVVIRDYAVQHLVALRQQMDLDAEQEGLPRALLQQVLWEAMSETDSSVAGTALLGLCRLAEEHPEEFDRNQIEKSALQLAGDSGAGELTHISAFQVCGQMSVMAALPLIQEAAMKGETLTVRISAINTLGALGSGELAPFLSKLADGTETRLKGPAQAALRRIVQREQAAAKANQKKI